MLFLTIFSISFVCANENLTYENAGELSSLSDLNPIDAVNENVDFNDEANDDSLAQTSENENDEYLVNNESYLLRSSNDVENENSVEKLGAANTLDILGASNVENEIEILGAGNDLTILGASNDVEILGDFNPNSIPNRHWIVSGTSAQDVINTIRDLSIAGGGHLYLNGGYYSGSGVLNDNGLSISNVWVHGGYQNNPNQMATFNSVDWEGALIFHGTVLNNCRFSYLQTTNNNGQGRFFTVSETYQNGQFYGSMSNSIIDNCKSYAQFYFVTGNDGGAPRLPNTIPQGYTNYKAYPVVNVSFINCDHTYDAFEDGHGQFVAALGFEMDGCKFINCTSGQHSSAICVNDESGYGPCCIPSIIRNTDFINLTAKWFAIYIHGRYESGAGAPTHDRILGIEVVENCRFINCEGTENYGGGIGISHDDVIVKNCTFINNTGGQGSAIMVGGIANESGTVGQYAFAGDNTKGNNITIQDCTFENCVATAHTYRWQGSNGQWHTDVSRGDGGAVYIVGNNTKVINSVFNNNEGVNGAAVYILGINTTVIGTTFSNNTASTNGAVYILGANTKISDSKFEDNEAINGAGTYIRGDNTQITNTEFNNNIADPNVGLGGAIDVIGDHCTLITVTCNNNSANCGGAGFIRGNNTIVRNSTFDNNKATLRGGGLDVYGDNFTSTDLEVSDNVAGTEGGAVYVVGDHAKFTYVTSINNTASRGGSTFIQGSNTVVTNCILDNNKAISNGSEGSGRGGGIDLAGDNCEVHDLEVSNNRADAEGGAIYIKSDGLKIYNINSTNNTATLGGSTYIFGDFIEVYDCILDGNNATLRGGGLNVYGNNCTVHDVEVSDNNAGHEGGAVYVKGNGATFYGVTSINNTASRGGSTFIEGNDTTVHDCILDGNKALYNGTEGSGRGGGLDIAGDDCHVYSLDVSDNNADREGGAVYIKTSNLYIYDIESDNNSAERGGSVFIEGNNITVADSVFNNNKAIFNESRNETSGIGGAIDITGNNCSFINVTSVNNTAHRGGSTFVRGNNTVIRDCVLDNNVAALRGGGINVAGDNCTIENVEVSNNNAGLMGGALYVNSNGTTMKGIIADNNTAERGGSAFINGTNIIVRDSEFNNNKAIFNESRNETSGLGGAFDIVGSNILVDNVSSNNNSAYRGGSSFIRGTNVTVQNSNLDNNSAELRGGALNIGGGEGSKIINVSVSNNHADTRGGAVYVEGDRALFDNVTSIHNSAEEGGSSYIAGNNVTVINCNLDNNSATIRGGGLAVTGDNCTFENVALSNCNATEQGGAAYVKGENSVFDNVTSIHNTAQYGGSSYIDGNNITVKNCNLDNNSAEKEGGGLYVSGENCTFENVALSNCHSDYGGAVYVDGNNNLFDNVTSVNNTAYYGGSSYIDGNNITVRNCNLDNNSAEQQGGGLYVSGDNCTFENVALSNCDANEGGAIYVNGNNAFFDEITSENNTAEYGGGSTAVTGDYAIFQNSSFTGNKADAVGGAISAEGVGIKFLNNNISSNEASSGGAIYVSGDDCEFSDNQISYNKGNFGGAINVWGDYSLFTNNNITYNSATAIGGAVYVDGYYTNFTNNNISSNHAPDAGAVYSAGHDLYLDKIYAYNNTAEKGGFAHINGADNLEVVDSTFYHNHALGDISEGNGIGGAFLISGSDNAIIQGNFSYNTAVNGSAIYLGPDEYGTSSNLKVHDSIFTDNQAWSYLLLATGDTHGSLASTSGVCDCNGSCTCPTRKRGSDCGCDPDCSCRHIMSIYEGENITIIVYHKGGDNIANGIYNNDSVIMVKNITYPFYTEDGQEIPKVASPDDYVAPILVPDNDDIYQYPFENNQIIRIEVYNNDTGELIRNVTFDEIPKTDINGATYLLLEGLPTGNYTVRAYYRESTYYTAINNVTKFRVLMPPIVDKLTVNGTVFLGQNVDFVVVVNNTLTDDNGTGVVLHNVTITEIFRTSELEYVDHTNKEKWVIGGSYTITEIVDGESVEYTCLILNYQGVLNFTESSNFTITFKTLVNGTLINTVNLTTNETGNYTAYNNTTVVPTSINVTKIWHDGDNAGNTRPDNITVELLADGVSFRNATLNITNDWKYTFMELPLYNGTNLINYTLREFTVANYTVVITSGANREFIIENTLVTVVNVTKIWDDANNTLNTRPANITVELFGDGISVGNGTLNASNDWKYTFTDLPVYNGTNVINYTIREVTVPNYIVNTTKVDNTTYVIVNTLVTDINITKIWNDGNNTGNTRPDSITVELFADGVSVGNGTLNASNDWKYTFTDLPVTNGTNVINYTISEFTVENYIVNITKVDNTTFVIVNTLVTDINVTKIWDDGNNTSNTRPANITVELLADGVWVRNGTLNASNDWKYTFTELPVFNGTNAINYTIREFAVPNYIVNITKVDNTTFVIVNSLVTGVNVTKIWDDGNNTGNTRPDSITVELFADGVWVRNGTLNASNDWKYTFAYLPVTNGTATINYTIREFEVPGYTVNITKVDNTTFMIVNTLVTDLNVTKIWNDGNNADNTRPANITVELLADGVSFANATLNADNNWYYSFTNLAVFNGDDRINYTISEINVAGYVSVVTNSTLYNWTITNTELVNITIIKVWTDNDNQDGVRPVNVTVMLFADEEQVGETITLNENNNWNYTFKDLIKFRVDGNLVEYRVNETPVRNYTAIITRDNNNFLINNTHEVELVNVTVVKVWTDNDNQDGVRPASVNVLLYADDENILNVTLSDANEWNHTFVGLNKFRDNGTEIVYRVNETEVINYTVNITGDNDSFVINNTHNVSLINVTVVKVWNDGNNVSGKRPANVTVVLLSDGEIIRDVTLNVSNNWTHTFVGLDKFKNNGTLIKYSIAEVNVGVPGYTTVITNSTAYNWTVNNTYVPKVNKTANETKVFYHDFVLYNITITNIGTGIYNETLTIVDSLPYGLDYNKTVNITGARVIQEGVYNNESRTITWIITDIDPDVPAIIFVLVGTYDIGNLTNNVTLIGPNGFNDTVNATVEVVPIVDVSVVKTVDNPNHFVDDIVVWTITVSNAANGTNATNVVLNDTFPPAGFILVGYNATEGTTYDMASGIWNIGFMGNGTSVTLTITSVAKQNGTFTNYANVTCNETEWNYSNNYDNATVVVVSFPINKTVSVNETYYNSNVTYNLTVSNIGNYTYTQNITVVDVLPDGIYYLRTIGVYNATVVANATQSGNNVTWVITNIDPNTTAVIEIEVWVHVLNPIDNTEIVILPNGTSMNVTVPLTVVPIVDVSVVKTVDNSSHFVDDDVVWTIVVSNAANGTNATNVVLNDTFPPVGFNIIGFTVSEGTSYDVSTGVWTIGDMANGTSVTLTITSIAKQNGTFTNYANVTCDEHEWNYSNNFDNATVVVVGFPINKTVSANETYYNSNVTFNLTVSNIGNYTYTQNITVVDVLPEGFEFIRTIGVYNAKVVANATQSGNNVTWVITNIDPNTTAVIEIEVRAHVLNTVINTEIVILPNGTNMTVSVPITVLPIVDVSVVKTVDNSTHFVDDTVVWTIVVSNAANGTNATNVVLKDTFPPAGFNIVGFTASEGTTYNIGTGVWTIGDMANGTSVTLTITSIAKQEGTFTNHANVNCTEHEWNYANNYDNATVVVFDIPDINKTVNNTTPFIYEYVLYNITITNVGNVTYIETLTVVDSLPEGLEYIDTVSITGADVVQIASVDGTGQVVTWKITNIKADVPAIITVKARANVLGNLTNNATVIGPNGTNKTVNCTIDVKPICDLEILKIVDKKVVYVNELVEWRIIVVNHGPSTAPNVVVKDNLPAGLKVIKATPSVGSFNKNTGIWSIGDIENNTSVFLVLVTQAVKEGSFTNVVVVNTTINETNYTNNKASNKTVVKPICDVEITKIVNFDKVYVGENVIWTIKVENNGPSTAKNVRVSDQLPKGLKVLDAKVTQGSFNMNTLEWTVGSLESGESAILKLTTRIVREGIFTNPVSVTTTTKETDYTNNKAKDTTEAIAIVDLSLKKYADKSVYHKGEKMHWTIVVTNHGPSTATGVVVNDVLPSGVKFIRFVASKGAYDPSTGKWDIGRLAKGETATIEIYCNVTAEVGTITNFASVTCNEKDSNPDNNNDSATITVEKVPDTPVTPPATMHPTGNPIVMVVLSLLAMVGVTLRRKL